MPYTTWVQSALSLSHAVHVLNSHTLALPCCLPQSIWCFENVMETGRKSGILTAEQPVLCKPNKQCFQLVLDQLGLDAESTIFIDDSVRNVAAAHELGIFSVLVSPAVAAQQSPHHHVAGADLVVANFNQLREVLPQVRILVDFEIGNVVRWWAERLCKLLKAHRPLQATCAR